MLLKHVADRKAQPPFHSARRELKVSPAIQRRCRKLLDEHPTEPICLGRFDWWATQLLPRNFHRTPLLWGKMPANLNLSFGFSKCAVFTRIRRELVQCQADVVSGVRFHH